MYTTYTRSDYRFGKHWHDVYGFGLLEDGAQSWLSGRGQVRAYAGSVISTNPGEVHDGEPLGASTRQWRIISVSIDAMAGFTDTLPGALSISRPVIEDPLFASVLKRVFATLDRLSNHGQKDVTGRLAYEEALIGACTLLMKRHGTPRLQTRPAAAAVHRARERLLEDPANPPTLSELAALTGLSRYQLLRRFTKVFGLPPHACLIQHRIEQARTLIRAGRSLAAAATSVGFADQSHMTRFFTRHYGYTPGEWKRAVAPQ
ncbi:MAG: helix-turn-helix domain-containing protein [Gemmatimonadaceae bacterium]